MSEEHALLTLLPMVLEIMPLSDGWEALIIDMHELHHKSQNLSTQYFTQESKSKCFTW